MGTGAAAARAEDPNVEVQHSRARAELAIECDGRRVVAIGLHEDHIGAPYRGDLLQLLEQRGGDAPAAMVGGNCQIVDVELAARLLELLQLVGGEAADDLAVLQRHQRGKGRSEEHTSELQSLMRITYDVFCLKKKHLQILNHR